MSSYDSELIGYKIILLVLVTHFCILHKNDVKSYNKVTSIH